MRYYTLESEYNGNYLGKLMVGFYYIKELEEAEENINDFLVIKTRGAVTTIKEMREITEEMEIQKDKIYKFFKSEEATKWDMKWSASTTEIF